MSKREMEEYERIGMVDSIQCRREEPTYYRAPETDQKWRARNVIPDNRQMRCWATQDCEGMQPYSPDSQ